MAKYQIKTFGGDSILLTDNQYKFVLEAYDRGDEELVINSQRVPRKAISFLGFTQSASEEQRMEEQEYFRSLSGEEQKQLKEDKFQYALSQARKNKVQKIEAGEKSTKTWLGIGGQVVKVEIEPREIDIKQMSEAEEIRGDKMYWVDEDGIKHFD